MLEKSVQDACIWVNETLRAIDLQSRLPSEVDCSSVSTLGGVCRLWSEFASILKIESKVDLLSPSVNETKWFMGHPELTPDDLYSGC